MTLAERLKAARTQQGISQKALGEMVGVSQAAIQKIETGKAAQTTKLMELAHALKVRPEWLSSGEEPMRQDRIPSLSPDYSTASETNLKVKAWENLDDNLKQDFVEVPLLNISLSAGPGYCVVDESSEFFLIFQRRYLKKMRVPENAAKLVRVNGRSMEPTLNDGDIVGINTNDTEIRDGKTYAICQADLLRVKILIATPDSVIIRSINRDEYPDEVIPRDQFHDQVRIIGRVFWSAHNW
ncbi:helix-turn-helix transcriptional regulator [Erwinia sp. PK3-005]